MDLAECDGIRFGHIFSCPSPVTLCLSLTSMEQGATWCWHAKTDPPESFVWYWHYFLSSWGHIWTQTVMAQGLPLRMWLTRPFWWALLCCALSIIYRQLYAQEAACRLQASERDGKSLQRLTKEEYLKMMVPDSPPGEERSRKVRLYWLTNLGNVTMCRSVDHK